MCTTKNGSKSEPWNLQKWQRQIEKDPSQFIKLFQMEPNLRPSIECLFEWWNWLTPTSVGRSPRYDTLFYFCTIDSWDDLLKVDMTIIASNQLSPSISTGGGSTNMAESIINKNKRIEWVGLDALFHCYEQRLFLISPCQLYELIRLASHPTIQSVKQFAIKREHQGIEQWIPSISIYKNGTISFLPGIYNFINKLYICNSLIHAGDKFYPEEVTELPTRSPRMYDSITLEDMRMKQTPKGQLSDRVNRIEHRGYWCRIVVDNYSPPKVMGQNSHRGHLAILYDQSPVIQLQGEEEKEDNNNNNNNNNGEGKNDYKIINSKL